MQWQKLFTEKFQRSKCLRAHPKSGYPLRLATKVYSRVLWRRAVVIIGSDLVTAAGIAILSFSLVSCASRSPQQVSAGIPVSLGSESDADSIAQGLAYMREHPSSAEGERIQRFLWLDQGIQVLQQSDQWTPEMAQEFWGDLTAFVKDEPALSSSALRRLTESSQTRLAKNIAAYHSYQAQLREQSLENALKDLESIEEDGTTDLYSKAQELLALYRSKAYTDSRKIGVLLPLSGDLKPLADEVLASVQLVTDMALSQGIEFVIQDTGDTPESLMKAWDRLMNQEKVTVVMGPLTSKESETVFEKAEISGLPVVSLAPKEGLEGFGNFGFRSVLTLEDQVQKLAQWAVETLKAKGIAILIPDSPYGMDVLAVAKRVFEERGLEIKGLQVYPADSRDFKDPLRKLVRLDMPRLRRGEICPKDIAPELQPAGCVKNLQELKPIIDFELLFLADSADNIGFLLPTLPYLRLYGIQTAGLSLLNSPRLIERAQEAAEGIVFTDGYVSNSKNFQTRWFREAFQAAVDREPSRLSAEAFDLAILLVTLMQGSSGLVTRESLVESLKQVRSFPGVTGSLYFENNKLKKDAKLLVVRSGQIQEWR